jgi:hypothetical protein
LIYFIQSGKDGAIKIGFSIDPVSRMRDLQVAHPETLRLIFAIDGNHELEAALHVHFTEKRIRGEWFDLDSDDLNSVITKIINGTLALKSETRKENRKKVAKMLLKEPSDLSIIVKIIESINGDRAFSADIAREVDMTPKKLSTYLARFGIRPMNIRIGTKVSRGYYKRNFFRAVELLENPFIHKHLNESETNE